MERPWKVCFDNILNKLTICHAGVCKHWPKHTVLSSHATENSAKCKLSKLQIIRGIESALNK